MDAVALGKEALTGWRRRVGDLVAGPLANSTPLNRDQALALTGLLFFALSTYYVVSTLRRVVRAAGQQGASAP